MCCPLNAWTDRSPVSHSPERSDAGSARVVVHDGPEASRRPATTAATAQAHSTTAITDASAACTPMAQARLGWIGALRMHSTNPAAAAAMSTSAAAVEARVHGREYSSHMHAPPRRIAVANTAGSW